MTEDNENKKEHGMTGDNLSYWRKRDSFEKLWEVKEPFAEPPTTEHTGPGTNRDTDSSKNFDISDELFAEALRDAGLDLEQPDMDAFYRLNSRRDAEKREPDLQNRSTERDDGFDL